MKRFAVLALLYAAITGCIADETDDADHCSVSVVKHKRLPAVSPFDAIVQTCTNCPTNTCDVYGPPCDAFMSVCDTPQGPGVCKACCDNGDGVLRCAPTVINSYPGNGAQ